MTLSELCKKDVVQLGTGTILGKTDDLIFDEQHARIEGLLLRGRLRWFGLKGRDEDIVIPWQEIQTIGQDVILVTTSLSSVVIESRKSLFSIFAIL